MMTAHPSGIETRLAELRSVLTHTPQSAYELSKQLGWTVAATVLALNAGIEVRQVALSYASRASRKIGMYTLYLR